MVKSLRITDTDLSPVRLRSGNNPLPPGGKEKKKEEVENPHCKMPMPMLITISKAS